MAEETPDSTRSLGPLYIHATNVVGLGAQQVVISLLDALLPLACYDPITVFLPEKGDLANYHSNQPNVRTVLFRRKLPRQLSRLLECAWLPKPFRGETPLLVLGDVPLGRRRRQVVLVHQAHLLSPLVNPLVGRNFTMRTMRAIFRRNHSVADALVVQTDVMRDQLADSYTGLYDRIHVIPQPPPTWALQSQALKERPETGLLNLFYPAAYRHPHKNHSILYGMGPHLAKAGESGQRIKISVTLQDEPAQELRFPPFVEYLGHLNVPQVQEAYKRTNALFYPSLLESFGLPLVEAICMDLPIVCADLPYARWLCEDQAFYFDPSSPKDAVRAIIELHKSLAEGWWPDYRRSRSKLPNSWQEVARSFLDLLGKV